MQMRPTGHRSSAPTSLGKSFATGSCRCTSVSLTIAAKPKMMVQCHCLDCQGFSGSGHASLAYFDVADVNISGETVDYSVKADSGAEMSRSFCPTCGSRLFGSNSERPDLLAINIGCLENSDWFKPQAVLYTSRRHDWDITTDEIPQFEKMPDNE
jgi:hypothetical protein